MALGLLTGSKNIGRNKGNSNAKFAITSHQRSKVMVEQIRKRNNWKLGGTHKTIHKSLQIDIQAASVDRRSQSLRTTTQLDTKVVYPKVDHYQEFGSRSFKRKSNRRFHARVATRRPSRRDG
jgi:hypothetical protein